MQPKSKKSELTLAAKQALALELPVIEAALRRVLPHLDIEATECNCCGLLVAKNFADLQASEVIKGALKKLCKLKA